MKEIKYYYDARLYLKLMLEHTKGNGRNYMYLCIIGDLVQGKKIEKNLNFKNYFKIFH